MEKAVMLTTIDNPYDPFIEYDKWEAFDTSNGYYSNALLARVAKTSPELSEEQEAYEIEQAIDEIVRENLSGMHRKVEMSME
jgi:hypothetical protein